MIYSFIISPVIYSFIFLSSNLFIYSFIIYLFIHSFVYLYIHFLIHLFIYWFIFLLTYLFNYLPIYWFNNACFHSFIHSFIHSLIFLFPPIFTFHVTFFALLMIWPCGRPVYRSCDYTFQSCCRRTCIFPNSYMLTSEYSRCQCNNYRRLIIIYLLSFCSCMDDKK